MAVSDKGALLSLVSPPSIRSWSGSCSGGCSIRTFHSSTASDPLWREPVERLRRWKVLVAEGIRIVREKGGKDGLDVIARLPLRARKRCTELLMIDGSPLPDNLDFWKSSHAYLERELRRIRGVGKELDGGLRGRRKINPQLDWIYDWIAESEAARVAGGLDTAASEAAPYESLSSSELQGLHTKRCDATNEPFEETPPAQRRKRKHLDVAEETVREQSTPRKHLVRDGADTNGATPPKRPRHNYSDADDKTDENRTSLSKRAKRKHPSVTYKAKTPPPKRSRRQQSIEHTSGKRRVAPASQRLDKHKTRITTAENRQSNCIASHGDGTVKREMVCKGQVQQPLRRSQRIAVLNKAKAHRY